MTQFNVTVTACLKAGKINFEATIKSLKDLTNIKIKYHNHITFINHNKMRHFVFFIETSDGKEIGVFGENKKILETIIVANDLGVEKGHDVEVTFYNDNEIFKSNKKSFNGIPEPREAGNGGVVGVTSC